MLVIWSLRRILNSHNEDQVLWQSYCYFTLFYHNKVLYVEVYNHGADLGVFRVIRSNPLK